MQISEGRLEEVVDEEANIPEYWIIHCAHKHIMSLYEMPVGRYATMAGRQTRH